MVDFRTNYAKDIAALVQKTYGSQIAIFKNVIPMSVKAAETSAEGISIYTHCPKGKVSIPVCAEHYSVSDSVCRSGCRYCTGHDKRMYY